MAAIGKMAIYPTIGIARVGNSPEFFLASELPGQPPVTENCFKDDAGRVKKQAALFRIYAMDEQGRVIKEITSADGASITWRVHVANRKAGWYRQDWLRDFGTQYVTKINAMVKRWYEPGIIVSHPLPAYSSGKWLPAQLWVESDRKTFDEENPTFEQVLIAEDANKPLVQAAEMVLDKVAGREGVAARPTRERPHFIRDEM